MNDINLLPHQSGGQLKEDKTEAMLRRVAIFTLSATAFITIVLFILTVQSPLSKAKQREEKLISSLTLSAKRISQNSIIQERLKSIDTILKTRSAYDKNLTELVNLAPTDVTLSSIQIKKSTMEISGNSFSYDAINIFLDKVSDLKQKNKNIKTVVMNTYAQQTDIGKYFFTLQITYL